MSTEFLSRGPEDTASFARGLAEKGSLGKGSVVHLHGGIGCGKTTFVKGYVSFWELDSLVTSPTFTIINEYVNDRIRILHADLYRLGNTEEVRETGLEDQMARSDLSFIEWPGNAKALTGPGAVNIRFSMGDKENERSIVMD